MLVYLSAGAINGKSSKESRAWMKSLERDTQSLNDYVGFLSNKITFLLDTVVGLVSVEQNAIIKIFSVAAVVFMPPTLVASIYGMNFHNMPELSWLAGYPYALGLMLVSAILPILYFRRKGWL
jgi:magnesium transporter